MLALNLNFAALSIELILLISGIGIFLIDKFSRNKNYAFYLTLVVLSIGFIFLLFTPFGEFTSAYKTDFYSNTLKFILFISFFLVIIISYSYLQDYKALNFGEYYGLLLFSMMGAFIMLSSQDLLTLFLGLELMSIPVYFLIGSSYVYKKNSLEGALKYFIAGAISSLLFLLGLGIVYYLIGSLYLKDLFVKLVQNTYKKELFIGFLFFLGAFSIKLSFVPFHMWAPDAYESAPLPITAFLASLIKLAIFGALIKLIILGYAPLRIDLGNLLAPISLLTIFLGALMAIKQDNIVRMLAYSSIAHAGYASLGIVAGDYMGYGFSLFYILVYLFMTIGTFSLLIYLVRLERSFLYIPALSGLGKGFPMVSFLILLFFFSLAGVPPTAGFMAKFYLFIMLLKSNYVGIAILALLFSVMGAYPYLRVLKVIYMEKPIYDQITKKNYGFSLLFVVIFCAFIIIWLGVYPSPVVDFIQRTLYLYLSFLYFHF
ncbi:MAG: NADH-quinone oxidoreductase subunit N [Caldimicrobium sp.]